MEFFQNKQQQKTKRAANLFRKTLYVDFICYFFEYNAIKWSGKYCACVAIIVLSRGHVTRVCLPLSNKSELRWDSFHSKLPSNSGLGLLPLALVRPLTGPAVWLVIYVYDGVVGSGCRVKQDGNPLIKTLRCTAFIWQPSLYGDNKAAAGPFHCNVLIPKSIFNI